jgi:hypothetical protein
LERRNDGSALRGEKERKRKEPVMVEGEETIALGGGKEGRRKKLSLSLLP